MDFCTLGMFIIDDIYPAPSARDQTPQLSFPGGAGTYCAIGARLVSPSTQSNTVGWIVDCGTDFPPHLLETIQGWQTGVLLRQRDALTTKGWNGYSANEHRDFRYLTPKLRITEDDLTPELLASKSFHMVCGQERCRDLVQGITARRKKAHPDLDLPLFIYEPVPDLAIPEALQDTLDVLKHVQVISPNHAELANIFGRKAELEDPDQARRVTEECALQMLEHAGRDGYDIKVVVRAGADGCYVAANGKPPVRRWLPAVHGADQDKVIDPTGGGNGFLGGLAVGLVRTGDIVQAAQWGSVSASFCIEQVGIPVLTRGSDGKEKWNGVDVQERLDLFEHQYQSL